MMHLVIANKRYSSWSLRPWLVMTHFGIAFEETAIPLRQPETAARIRAVSPSGKVPALIDDDVTVWDSLAIVEYLHENDPALGVWPSAPAARAHARSICAEMHSGFMGLRGTCPMDLAKRYAPCDRGEAVDADVARICHIFRETRERFGAGGPFLFGAFSAADAMFAPVVTRFHTYSIAVDDVSAAYMQAIVSLPAFQAWRSAALAETWEISAYAKDEPVLEDYRSVPKG